MFMVAARRNPTVPAMSRLQFQGLDVARSAGAYGDLASCSAVKVLTKKLSPPRTERRSPPKMPPRVLVSILMLSDILTMAPVSA